MFLWVHLIFGILRNASSAGELKREIDSLPTDLAKAYIFEPPFENPSSTI